MTSTEFVQPVLKKKLPAALVVAFLLQTAGALFRVFWRVIGLASSGTFTTYSGQ